MNRLLLVLLILVNNLVCGAAIAAPQTVVFDQVVAVVYQNEAPDLGSKEEVEDNLEIITKQDIDRAGFDGAQHSVESEVSKKEFVAKANKLKMAMSDEDVDSYLKKANLNEEQQLNLAERWYYDGLAEFKAALKEMYVSSMCLGYDVEASLVISEDDIKNYYDDNPVWLEPEYEIQTSFVAAKLDEQTVVKNQLEQFAKTGKGFKLVWEDVIVVKLSEVSAINQFLSDMKVGQIYIKPVYNGFDLFKMMAIRPRRLQPLSERRSEIVSLIRQERYPKVVEQVKADLHAKSSVYYPVQY